MSATRILNQVEADAGFSLLKDIIQMVKNPSAIDAAYDQRRKQVALTEQEAIKAKDDREFMAKADSIREELKQKESGVLAKEIAHSGNVDTHEKKVKSENSRLYEWEAKLNAMADKQRQISDEHIATKKELEKRSAALTQQEADLEERKKGMAVIEANAKADEEKRTKHFSEWEAKLKAKAARLVAEAQKDD